jgi:hypothetical protein
MAMLAKLGAVKPFDRLIICLQPATIGKRVFLFRSAYNKIAE